MSYADDAVLLRLALQKALGKGEDEDAFRDRFPELFENLDENLDALQVRHGRADDLAREQGRLAQDDRATRARSSRRTSTTRRRASSSFDDGLVFRTDYPVDEKTIGDKLKKAATIIEVMKRRKADEARAKGISA